MVRKTLAVFIPLILLISIYFYLNKNGTSSPKDSLVVYTYSSFAASWGAGPEIKKLFEQKTGRTVEFIDVGESGIILQRILLEKENSKADMVLGLDQFQIANPDIQSLFYEFPTSKLNLDESVPQDKVQLPPFVAYNWAPMTLIYRNSEVAMPPKKLDDLISDKFKGKIILLDPRSSAPGFIFFNWLVQKSGKELAVDFIYRLKKNIYNVAPSWSSGYGLFKKKNAQYIFSYITSPTYHLIEEKNSDYLPLYLDEDLPYHMEYAGVLDSSPNKTIAKEFMDFMLEPEVQKIIMNKNYMLPVIAKVKNNTEFDKIKKVNLFESQSSMTRQEVLNVWNSIAW